jgi:hypothetical protein
MRSIGLTLVIVFALLAPPAAAATYPTCHLHKSRDVSFRDATSKDVLEVSIGTGPCSAATLTIVIRAQTGEVLYSYVAPFARHRAGPWQDPTMDKQAIAFVDELIANGVGSSRDLPPYLEPNAYAEANSGEIRISRKAYEELRTKPRPMFEHANHYEGWQVVVYDKVKEEAVIVVMGGV